MHEISATQIKAARAMLGWLQNDLAEACGLSSTTIRSLETGNISPRSATVVRKAFEQAGLEFIEGDGVRRRDNQIRVYKGLNSCNRFFEDMAQAIKEGGGGVVCTVKSQEMLMQSCGITARNNHERMEMLEDIADIKCLMPEPPASSFCVSSLQVRVASKHQVGPFSYYVYADKYVLVYQERRSNFTFVIHHMPTVAQDMRNHFLIVWENALPLRVPASSPERRARIPVEA